MKLKDLFEEQKIVQGSVRIPEGATTLIGYKFKGVAIAGAKINGFFDCSNTNITSLEGAPSETTGSFDCYGTEISSLDGAPKYVGNNFVCFDTKISSLEGTPNHVGSHFNCSNTKIASLQNIHKQVKFIGMSLILPNTLKSHILGVMFIKGLKEIIFIDLNDNDEQAQVADIINKHLEGDRDPHETQEELIEAGFSEYAKI